MFPKSLLNFKIFLKYLLFSFLLFFLLAFPQKAKTGSEHNVWGWAWMETIGWVSFNCNSTVDTNGDGIGDQAMKICDGRVAGEENGYKVCNPGFPEAVTCSLSNNCIDACNVVNYGTHIDLQTGIISGYAWSENIGWISFDRSVTGAPPREPYLTETFIAKVDPINYEFTGWARAIAACPWDPVNKRCTDSGPCANCGGWDGWISLRNP